jgi:cell wall-associated NlpC family hydrolase
MCDCSDLIGRPYELGADGSGPEIDCIHLVYTVLKRMGIAAPTFNPGWYSASKYRIYRDLLAWGQRVPQPEYDGDVVLVPQDHLAFGVTWQSGILYINRHLMRVAWCPLTTIDGYPCFRMKSS